MSSGDDRPINQASKSFSIVDSTDAIKQQPSLRNAVTTEKRENRDAIIRLCNLKPVRLTSFMQELLEAENEPLRRVVLPPQEFEDDDEPMMNGLPKKTPGKPANNENFTVVKPVVEPVPTLSVDLPTVKGSCSASPEKPFESSWNVSWLDISLKKETTPKTAIVTNRYDDDLFAEGDAKIQCRIDMKQSVAKTLFDKMLPKAKQQRKVAVTRGTAVTKTTTMDSKVLLPILEDEEKFKTIVVNGVEYMVMNQLGMGGSCVVYYCFDWMTKSEYAIKKVDISNPQQSHMFLSEVEILKKLRNCNRIVKMFEYEILQQEKTLLIVLERGTSNFSNILKTLAITNKHLPVYMLVFYWMEMLQAVKQIHEHGIVHNDLKPSNFLVFECGLKLIDFGISAPINDDMTSAVRDIQVGSLNYISPEALIDSGGDGDTNNALPSNSDETPRYKLRFKSDVWSLGCILYQLVYKQTPFQHLGNNTMKLLSICNPEHKIEYQALEWVPEKITQTMKWCLQFDFRKRPSVQDLIKYCESWV